MESIPPGWVLTHYEGSTPVYGKPKGHRPLVYDSVTNPPPKLTSLTPTPKRIRQSSKPLMNKLELEGYEWAKRQFAMDFRPQAMRFKLANGLWYKPDLTSKDTATRLAIEIKGPFAFRGGFENLKSAATLYQEWEWWLIWKVKGQWQSQKVLP